MGQKINKSIIIDAKIKTTLEGMDQTVSKLNEGLRKGVANLDLTKGIGNSISKNIDKFKDEYDKFSKSLKPLGDGKGFALDFNDSKEAIKSGEQMVKIFSELKRVVGNFEDLSIIDAKKLFPDAFDSRVDDLQRKIEGFQKNLNKLEIKRLEVSAAKDNIKELEDEGKRIQELLNARMEMTIQDEQARNTLKEVNEQLDQIRDKARQDLTLKISEERAK